VTEEAIEAFAAAKAIIDRGEQVERAEELAALRADLDRALHRGPQQPDILEDGARLWPPNDYSWQQRAMWKKTRALHVTLEWLSQERSAQRKLARRVARAR
jgi:hypothetical protein